VAAFAVQDCGASLAIGSPDRPAPVAALPAPPVYGNVAINRTLLVGGTVVLMDRFDPDGGEPINLSTQHPDPTAAVSDPPLLVVGQESCGAARAKRRSRQLPRR
jgi:hypothetical protein